MTIVGQPINLTATPQPASMRLPCPQLGEHTDDVLAGLGYDQAQIADLHERGIV